MNHTQLQKTVTPLPIACDNNDLSLCRDNKNFIFIVPSRISFFNSQLFSITKFAFNLCQIYYHLLRHHVK